MLLRSLIFVCAVPFGLLLCLGYLLISKTLKFKLHGSLTPPKNALVFFTHSQLYSVALNPYTKKHGPVPHWVFGYHGFLPYVWVILDKMVGIVYVLFNPKRPRKMQILESLNGFPERRFAIATDSGGPYGIVRPSLVQLSLASKRPLVGMQVLASRTVTVAKHHLPLPFSTLTVRFTEAVAPEELERLGEKAALEKMQTQMDFLCERK